MGSQTYPPKAGRVRARYCPVYRDFATGYHWSADQCEYATDIVFRQQADLQAIYENLARTAIHTVKPDNIATFLGRKLSTRFEGEMGNRFNIRIEGTRSSIRWDQFRLSCTTSSASFCGSRPRSMI